MKGNKPKDKINKSHPPGGRSRMDGVVRVEHTNSMYTTRYYKTLHSGVRTNFDLYNIISQYYCCWFVCSSSCPFDYITTRTTTAGFVRFFWIVGDPVERRR